MKAADKLEEWGFEDVVIFENPSYDEALIGVTTDNRAVYDYERMVKWLIRHNCCTRCEAIEWIEYNTLRAIPYYDDAPIIMHRL
jgi:hypothetical protein